MIKLEERLVSANFKHRNIRNFVHLLNREKGKEGNEQGVYACEENKANFTNPTRNDRWIEVRALLRQTKERLSLSLRPRVNETDGAKK